MIKKITAYIFAVLMCLSVICFTACDVKKLKPVHFCLNKDAPYFNPSGVTLIKNTEEFEIYLSDRTIFKDEFCEEFIEENKKYDEDFFSENDLIAVRIWATSGSYTGYRLEDLYKSDGKWILSLSGISKKKVIDAMMGEIFCYYIAVEKDASITGAKFEGASEKPGLDSMTPPVHFCLNDERENFSPTGVTLIKNTEEFETYLSNRELFKEEFHQEFINENKKYDESFFAGSDLLSVIIRATSGSIEGHRIWNLYKSNGNWIVKLLSVSEGQYETADMGKIFCYYIPVEKDASVTGAEFKW